MPIHKLYFYHLLVPLNPVWKGLQLVLFIVNSALEWEGKEAWLWRQLDFEVETPLQDESEVLWEWELFSTPWLCAAEVVGRTSLGMTRARESGPQMQDLPGHWWFSYLESGTVTEDSRSKGTQRLEQRGLWVARSTLTKIRTERAPDDDYDSVVHHLCGKRTWSHIRLEL